MKTFRPLAVALLVVIIASGAAAFDLDGRLDLGIERVSLLRSSSAMDVVSLPLAAISPGDWRIDLGGIRRYDLSELDQFYAAAAHRIGSFTLALGVSQLGDADLYAERTGVLSFGWQLSRWSLGAKWSARHVSFGEGYSSLSTASVGFAAAFCSGRFALAIAADNLTEPRYYDGAVPFDDTYMLHVELAGPGEYIFGGSVTVEQDERPRFGLGQRFDLEPAGRLFWSIATAPLTHALGGDIMYHGSRLAYSVSYHPTLGLSHLFSIGWTIGGKRT